MNMQGQERDGVQLGYGRAEVVLRRPWYVWVGAGMATLWLAALGVAAVCGIVALCVERGTGADKVLALMVLALLCFLVTLLLILEWRAIFRRSANASAIVGLLLAFPALFAGVAEVQVFVHHEKMPAVVGLGVLASSLGFCVWSHFQWARVIANWLTRSLEAVATRGEER